MAEHLTVETSAAIGAFIQELHIRAEGGNPVDEETLALRMLASSSMSPDYDFSTIKSLNAGDGPVTAAADSNNKFDQLMTMMMGDTKPTEEQVAAGQVPKPPPVVILPGYTSADAANNYAILKDAHSMIQLYSNLMQVQQKPDGFNILTEAGSAFAYQAKTAYNAMMGPLAGYFMFSTGSQRQFENPVTQDQVHNNLLQKMFEGFGFDPSTIAALDVQLTSFVSGLKSISPEAKGPNTFDFSQLCGLCPRVNVTGDPSDPIYVYSPTTYLLYMKVDAVAFRQSTGKNSSTEKINFKFDLSVIKCELNTRKFEADRPKFDKIFEHVTSHNLRAYSDLLNKQIQTKEENPGAAKK